MIVIADTSPINYLVEIGHIDVLPQSSEWFEVVTCSPRLAKEVE
jgi:predicted nucleic acid-binding protein